jgi:hypothetical protein
MSWPSFADDVGGPGDAAPPADEVPPDEEVKLRVPSCPALEVSNIVRALSPYRYVIDQVQAILLWRRPSQFAATFGTVAAVFMVVHLFRLNILSSVVFLTAAGAVAVFVFDSHRSYFVAEYFPPVVDRGQPTDPDRVYSLEELAGAISIIGSRIHCFWLGCVQKATDQSVVGQVIWLLFLLCMFALFAIIPTLLVMEGLALSIVVLPGVLFHPAVYDTMRPTLDQLMRLIAPKVRDRPPNPEG